MSVLEVFYLGIFILLDLTMLHYQRVDLPMLWRLECIRNWVLGTLSLTFPGIFPQFLMLLPLFG